MRWPIRTGSAALVGALEARPDAGMCASQVRLFGEPRLDSAGMLVARDGSSKQRGHGRLPEDFPVPEEVLLASGSSALYRRSMLEDIGGFDDDFFLYCEDTDLGLRARWAGWKCLYVPQAVVEHHYSHSAGRASPVKAYYVERNRLFVLVKNFPVPYAAGRARSSPWRDICGTPGTFSRAREAPRDSAPKATPGPGCSGTWSARTPPCSATWGACGGSGVRSARAPASRPPSSGICCAATPSAPEGWPPCDQRQAPDSLLIIVPALNEEAAIGGVVRDIHQHVPGVPVLVIDDCSSDSTMDVAREAGAEVLPMPHHLGLGGCVQAGYKLAYELGFQYVIRVDGDGQHDAARYPPRLREAQELRAAKW